MTRAWMTASLFLALAPMAAEAKALPFVTGRALLTWCRSAEPADAALCRGHVAALADLLVSDQTARPACFPLGTRVDEMITVVTRSLGEHPERGFDQASIQVADALREGFPCR